MEFDLMRLRAERVAKGLTQEEMAKKLGISRQAYAKRENGEVNIGVDELAQIGDILNINSDNLSKIFFTKFVH